ncbi:MAG: IclR family transcriptional regulator [Candidatus Adiutrix sp.]|jgi:DNA-binding IclR family transcriptional regulator|nr:IclR family transcriptional regulator [Candidatus Adiutrix sp.]
MGEKINSIMRVLDIMECFAFNKSEYALSELADELSLPLSTVHRQLNTLIARGYVQQNQNRKLYQIGSRMFLLGCATVGRFDLKRAARPFLQKLSAEVEETVHLCGLDGFNMYYVDKIESLRSVRCISGIGRRLPAHATASGKMLLSDQPPEFIDEYCQALPSMPVYTKNTIVDPEILRDALKTIKKQGYSLDIEEIEEGLICVSAPLYNYDQKMEAAISISGPIFRMEGQLGKFVDKLKAAALEISQQLGYVVEREAERVYDRPDWDGRANSAQADDKGGVRRRVSPAAARANSTAK